MQTLFPAHEWLESMTNDEIYYAINRASTGGYPDPNGKFDFLIQIDGIRHELTQDRTKSIPEGGYPSGWVWAERHGKPWQAALEEIVRRDDEASWFMVGM